MSTNKAGTNNGAHGRRIHAVPTPEEIDAGIADLIATHAADDARMTEVRNTSWFAVAIDPRGVTRDAGMGRTPAEACVNVWIRVWLKDDFSSVPRVVPEGWRFEVRPPGQLYKAD